MFRVIKKSERYDFGSPAVGFSVTVPVARGVNVADLRHGKLVTRLENGSLPAGPTSASVAFTILGSWPDSAIPEFPFAERVGAVRGTTTITATTAVGESVIQTGDPVELGPAIDVFMTVTQATASPGPLVFTVSVGIWGWDT